VIETGTDRWRLPDGVDEWLPDDARRLDRLRRRFVDLGAGWGFEPVMPPLIEYLDSLLTGTGEVMDLQTFKLIDQQDGRALGVRADMTPQVARIDAHSLGREVPTRLMYTGTVLRARTDAVGDSRNPLQFGAELFGHAGVQSDLEVCRLMLESVLLSGIDPASLTLSLGHVGVYAGLVEEAGCAPVDRQRLYDAMVRGSAPDVQRLIEACEGHAGDPALQALGRLPLLRGGIDMLEEARGLLADRATRAIEAIATLTDMVEGIARSHPDVAVHLDLGDLRGYRYHTGMLFAAHDGAGVQLARGGRYDAIGQAFGKARPATGFSGDLARLAVRQTTAQPQGLPILLADPEAEGAWQAAARLRAEGECVISSLACVGDDVGIERELVRSEAGWTVQARIAS